MKRVTTNDVGILTLPRGGGPLIIAIYLTVSPQPLTEPKAARSATPRLLRRSPCA